MSSRDLGYPTNAEQWGALIEAGLGLSREAGRRALREGTLPKPAIRDLLARTYSPESGMTPLFLAALTRNFEGLLAWVYGDAGEPYWPGCDPTPGP